MNNDTVDVFLSEYQVEWHSIIDGAWFEIGPRTGLLCEAVQISARVQAELEYETRIRVVQYAPLNRWLMPN